MIGARADDYEARVARLQQRIAKWEELDRQAKKIGYVSKSYTTPQPIRSYTRVSSVDEQIEHLEFKQRELEREIEELKNH
jgi:hypothetical protein